MGCGGSKSQRVTEANKKDTAGTNGLKKTGGKPVVIFVLGAPGSGKGTQCERIRDTYHLMHLSVGDLLREEQNTGSDLAKTIHEHIVAGTLVPAEIPVQLLEKAMKNRGWDHNQYLIDGFPRNQDNLDTWKKLMGDKTDDRFILFYDCSFDIVEKRLIERGKTSGREDDNIESIKKRFDTYTSQTLPVVQAFEKDGRLKKIDASRPIDDVFKDTRKVLDEISKSLTNKDKKSIAVFVNGGPGSGKGTQCDKIKKEYKVNHVSVGDLLREEIKNKSPLASEIKKFQDAGKLVPSSIPVKALKNYFFKHDFGTVFLVDGFPRNHENVTEWDKQIGDLLEVKGLLFYDASPEVLEKRMLERAKTSGRSDDNPETIKARLKVFKEDTEAVVKAYEAKGLVAKIPAEGTIEEVYARTKENLEKYKIPKLP